MKQREMEVDVARREAATKVVDRSTDLHFSFWKMFANNVHFRRNFFVTDIADICPVWFCNELHYIQEAARMDTKVMEALQGEEEVLEIHERCLEDADKRAQQLEVEKRGLEEKVERLEVEGQELRARLEAGAKHYRSN